MPSQIFIMRKLGPGLFITLLFWVAASLGCSDSSKPNPVSSTGGYDSGGSLGGGGTSAAGGASAGSSTGSATGGSTTGGTGGSPGSGGSGGSAGTNPSGSLAGYCGAVYDERKRCGSLPEGYRSREADIANCVREFGRSEVYRGDVFGAIQACLDTLACDSSVDSCNMAGALVVSSDPLHHPLVTGCMAKVADCKASATPLHDDACLLGLFLLESLKPDFDTCMGKPCDSAGACVKALLGQ